MSQNRKSLMLICLSILTIGSIPIANAQILVKSNSLATETSQTTPANLVYLAHRGYFQQQGIPSYLYLRTAYNLGRVTALDIVRAAVQANRISSDYKSDRFFVKAVARQLKILNHVH